MSDLMPQEAFQALLDLPEEVLGAFNVTELVAPRGLILAVLECSNGQQTTDEIVDSTRLSRTAITKYLNDMEEAGQLIVGVRTKPEGSRGPRHVTTWGLPQLGTEAPD